MQSANKQRNRQDIEKDSVKSNDREQRFLNRSKNGQAPVKGNRKRQRKQQRKNNYQGNHDPCDYEYPLPSDSSQSCDNFEAPNCKEVTTKSKILGKRKHFLSTDARPATNNGHINAQHKGKTKTAETPKLSKHSLREESKPIVVSTRVVEKHGRHSPQGGHGGVKCKMKSKNVSNGNVINIDRLSGGTPSASCQGAKKKKFFKKNLFTQIIKNKCKRKTNDGKGCKQKIDEKDIQDSNVVLETKSDELRSYSSPVEELRKIINEVENELETPEDLKKVAGSYIDSNYATDAKYASQVYTNAGFDLDTTTTYINDIIKQKNYELEKQASKLSPLLRSKQSGSIQQIVNIDDTRESNDASLPLGTAEDQLVSNIYNRNSSSSSTETLIGEDNCYVNTDYASLKNPFETEVSISAEDNGVNNLRDGESSPKIATARKRVRPKSSDDSLAHESNLTTNPWRSRREEKSRSLDEDKNIVETLGDDFAPKTNYTSPNAETSSSNHRKRERTPAHRVDTTSHCSNPHRRKRSILSPQPSACELSSSSYGGSRYGSTSGGIGSSYLSTLGRDRSGSRDASGYGSDYKSGYGSGTGTTPYSSRFSTSSKGDGTKGIASIASKFGDTSAKPRDSSSTLNSTEKGSALNSYTRTRSRDLSNVSLRSTNDTVNSSLPPKSEHTSKDIPASRSRTSNLPINQVPTSGDKSKYSSDVKAGYGSDYSKSGYGSGYSSGGLASRYNSWNKGTNLAKEPDTSYRRTYSRENSQLSSDADSSGWRSRVYGNDQTRTSRPTTLSIPNNIESKQTSDNDVSPRILKRPSAFQLKQSPKTPENNDRSPIDKKTSLPSPNAVKVLPTLNASDLQLKNKAPADFSSCSELSDNDGNKAEGKSEKHSNLSPTHSKKVESPPTIKRTRTLRYLNAVPDLVLRKSSISKGLAEPPQFKLSDKLNTENHDLLKIVPTSSKWLREKNSLSPKADNDTKENVFNDNQLKSKPASNLPLRSPPLGDSKLKENQGDKANNLGIANKEYRKSVLNMNIQPDLKPSVQKIQEEKREEIGRLKKKGSDDNIKVTSKCSNNETESARQAEFKTSTKPEKAVQLQEESDISSDSEDDKLTVRQQSTERNNTRSKILERKSSKGKADSLRKSTSIRRSKESRSSLASKSSSTTSSESEEETKNYRARRNLEQTMANNIKNSSSSPSKSAVNIICNGDSRKSKDNITVDSFKQGITNNSKSTSTESSDSSSESDEEGSLFKIANSKSNLKLNSLRKKLSITPTVVMSFDGLGDRTSPDGKEKDSMHNSISDMNAALKEYDEIESELTCTYNASLPKKKSIDTLHSPSNSENFTVTASVSAFCENTNKDSQNSIILGTNNESCTGISSTNPVEDYEEFIWPDGSPKLKKKSNYFRTQWDTETETEMEGWSDCSIPKPRRDMHKLTEESEEESAFEWPSSPELWKKRTYTADGEDGDGFDWPSSPELPVRNDPKYIGFTTDIDSLLSEEKMEDTFAAMEKILGFPQTPEDTKPKNELDPDESLKIIPDDESITPTAIEESSTEESEPENNQPEEKQPSLRSRARKNLTLFIGKLTNIDEILGNVLQPLTNASTKKDTESISEKSSDDAASEIQEIHASDVKVHDAQAKNAEIESTQGAFDIAERKRLKLEALRDEIAASVKAGLDDTTLQIYRNGDYGTYLDLEGTLAEQADDIDGLTESKKNAIILRTQLSVRVHAIIEKLQKSEGRDLRRALFSLKQIFQDDKDLVHAFVQHGGLKCLVKVGIEADHNYQTYILRALGQVMLYVDGMTGISQNPETVEWLYSLVSSKFRLVVKTALKLLLVFVEYSEGNSLVLVKAINAIDKSKGYRSWGSLMHILEGKDCPDTELMIYTMTLINKALNGLPDQDNYYDQSDSLEEQGLETLIQKHMHNPISDLDLLQQLTIYEAVLAYEDGDDVCRTTTIDPTIRQSPRYSTVDREDINRRRSRRHCTTPSPDPKDDQTSSDDERGTLGSGLPADDLGGIRHAEAGVTPALRRRRERAERHRSFLHDQEARRESRSSESPDSAVEDENRKNAELSSLDPQSAKMIEVLCGKREGDIKDIASRIATLLEKENVDSQRKLPIELTMDTSVKDILKKLSTGSSLTTAEQDKLNRIGDVSGRIQRAKEGLALSHLTPDESSTILEVPQKSQNDVQWENLVEQLNRPLVLGDLDFTDLNEDKEPVDNSIIVENGVPVPPPPPPVIGGAIPPPPPNPLHNGDASSSRNSPSKTNGLCNGEIPPPPTMQSSYGIPFAPPPGFSFGVALQQQDETIKKSKKTIKLFWKEIRDGTRKKPTIWDSLEAVKLDTQRLEFLFESRAKDINTKEKQLEQKGMKEIVVLDPKRSNVINIGMTKLPPPRTIKTAILKMDSSIINREGIEKLLSTMLPTEEEKQKIQDAAVANPELPLGSAEQFLMMLSSISELPARLKLWLFKLDYENLEKEVADPLMDIKEGITHLQKNHTFKTVLAILLSIGNFLNGSEAKGFHLEYLSKVPEVKDTVNKHSLLHHLCHFVLEKFPGTSDLYSEIGAITRASRVDFDELEKTVERLEIDCKASWDYLKAIAKHDGPTQMKLKMSEFLADCAERIIVLGIIYKKIMNRFTQFLVWMGLSLGSIADAKAQRVCSVISEFALEYRTCRERVLQQMQKKANHRERNKTRGKMITEMDKFKTRPTTAKKSKEEEADSNLRQLLNLSDVSDTEAIRGKSAWRRTREGKTKSREEEAMLEAMTDGLDDALLDSLVKTATQAPTMRSTPRDRKRSRHADRKSSIKRSRTRDRSIIAELQTLQAVSETKD